MRFLVDECTGPAVAEWLRAQGHVAFSVYDETRGANDDAVLLRACAEDAILITNDKDFGEMVFRERLAHKGIVLLRLDNERALNKIDTLRKLLEGHAERLSGKFVVATETSVRFAHAQEQA